MIRFDIITIFPRIFDSYFNESILKRAREKKLVDIRVHNLRDYATDSRRTVDNKPYGGGAGMVLMAEPILRAVENLKSKTKNKQTKIIIFSAKGKPFNQKMAYQWSRTYKNFIFITGRYEGIDERVAKILRAEEISIGPYITTDGDVAAMVVVSAVTRLIPNVINWSSLEDESFLRKTISREAKTGQLEYPHYTRPEALKWKERKYRVPNVLLSGDHQKIEAWRRNRVRPVTPPRSRSS